MTRDALGIRKPAFARHDSAQVAHLLSGVSV